MTSQTDALNLLLLDLRTAGKEPDRTLLDRITAFGAAAVRPLIEMAVDEELHNAESESADVWAPMHAIQLLGELEAAEAVEPLLPFFDWDDDWLHTALPEAFGRIGLPALAPLRALLFDRSKNFYGRTRAADGLMKIGQYHPELRDEAVDALVARLDPAESQVPDDETLNGFVVSSLLDLKAVEAVPAIRRAFDEDRVDRRIVDFDSVVDDLGLPEEVEAPPADRRSTKSLWLRCTACHYERPHAVEKVYCDHGTVERKKRGEETPYSELVIPQRIVCPKCGAVDQYELTGDAHLTFLAEILKLTAAAEGVDLPGVDSDSLLVPVEFTLADGREMHPYEARDMYRQQIDAEPDRADLRVRYGNVLRFLGHREEAEAQYRMALDLDPTHVEAYVNLGNFALESGDRTTTRRMFERVVQLAPAARMPWQQRREYESSARKVLADLDRADRPTPASLLGGLRTALRPPVRAGAKVGRNDPCPCGSGKKYKKCCGA